MNCVNVLAALAEGFNTNAPSTPRIESLCVGFPTVDTDGREYDICHSSLGRPLPAQNESGETTRREAGRQRTSPPALRTSAREGAVSSSLLTPASRVAPPECLGAGDAPSVPNRLRCARTNGAHVAAALFLGDYSFGVGFLLFCLCICFLSG